MSESYDPNKIGTPCCIAAASVSSWQHEADPTYGKGVWKCISCTTSEAMALIKKCVPSAGWAGNMN